MKRIPALPLLLLLTGSLSLPCHAATAPSPKSGTFLRVIEAEHMPAKGKLTEARDEKSNVVYLSQEDDNKEPKENEAAITSFSVPADGIYYIWGRVWVQNDSADSMFVKIGPGRSCWVIEHEPKDIKFHSKDDWVIWNHMARKEHRKWIWARIGSLTQPKDPTYVNMAFRLDAGRHRICFAGREAGARLDKFLVTNDPTLKPDGVEGATVPAPATARVERKGSTPPPPPGLIRPLLVKTEFKRAPLKLAATLSLASANPSSAEVRRLAKGGKFVANGWQTMGKTDQLLIELKDGFGRGDCGALEIEMTNLNLPVQAVGPKHHLITVHGDPRGDAFIERNCPFFSIRSGAQYKAPDGRMGIKMLWRGGSGRGEEGVFGARDWDPRATYVWRCEWNQELLCIYLNGERIFGPAEFRERFAMPMKYVFLSTDGIDNVEYKYWYGMIGPIYKTIRVYR